MYNSLQRHSTSGLSNRATTDVVVDADYDNVEDCGGGAIGGNGGIVVHGDSGDSGVIVRESRAGGNGGRTMGDGMGKLHREIRIKLNTTVVNRAHRHVEITIA